MRIRRRSLAMCLVLIASLLLSSAASAQSTSAPNREWSALNAVELGSKLSVKLKTGKTVGGRLSGFSDTALSLTADGRAVDLNRADVLRVYRVGGRSATKTTLIGAGVGAGVGAALGAATNDDNDFIFTRPQAAAVLGAVGAGVGALTGFVIGKTGRKRVLIYEAAQP